MSLRIKKVLITGTAGFIGSQLTELLVPSVPKLCWTVLDIKL